MGITHLMMDIMVISVVPKHDLQRIERQSVSAMIVHSLESRKREQHDRLTNSQERYFMRQGGSARIKQETFQGMVVQRPERVRHIESMMYGVEMTV